MLRDCCNTEVVEGRTLCYEGARSCSGMEVLTSEVVFKWSKKQLAIQANYGGLTSNVLTSKKKELAAKN